MLLLPLKPLPDCEGPKLDPFTQDITAHDLEFLDIPYYENAHSIIARVKIDGRVYCLKLFYNFGSGDMELLGFFNKDCRPKDASPELQKLVSDHNDPFNCECRAFGRLKEVGCEHLAVRVYGYISLPLTKDILAKMHHAMKGHRGWERMCDKDGSVRTADAREILGGGPDKPDDGSWRVRGILKDWVGPADPDRLTRYEEGLIALREPSMFRRMLANLKALHQHGILVCDVHSGQWIDGTLVDLSCAMTTPHLSGPGGMAGRPSWTFASVAAWDLICFQTRIIDQWNDTNWSYFHSVTPPRRKCRLRAYDLPDAIQQDEDRSRQRFLEWCRKSSAPSSQEGSKPPKAALAVDPPRNIRDCLRPRPKQFGPFLPLLNNWYSMDIDLAELPPHDPAKFDWRAAAAAGAKRPRRKTGVSNAQGKKMRKRRADARAKTS